MNVSTSYTHSTQASFSFQSISKTTNETASTTSQKVLGYEVDEKGYFKSDFNKAAGIPDDFKIHSDTMLSLVSMNDRANPVNKMFFKVDIAKTAKNAYKILTQLVDDKFLSKQNYTRDEIKSMPQGYDFNAMSMKVTRVFKTANEYMMHDGDTRAENVHRIPTFYNASIRNYWNTPQGGNAKASADIFNNNIGGREGKAGLYFNSHGERYTNTDGSITKGGLLVGIINKNFKTRDGETTFWGKLQGMDKQVSFKEAHLKAKMLFEMYPVSLKIPETFIASAPKDIAQYIRDTQKMSRTALMQSGSMIPDDKYEDTGFRFKAPIDYLYEQMEEEKKLMLKNMQKKAEEAKLKELEELRKQTHENLMHFLTKESAKSLNDFTNFFTKLQDEYNQNAPENLQSNYTELEVKKAFLSLFERQRIEEENKKSLDVAV